MSGMMPVGTKVKRFCPEKYLAHDALIAGQWINKN